MSVDVALKLVPGVKVDMIGVDDLEPNPLQPRLQRTTPGQLKRLQDDIVDTRFIAPLTVVNKYRSPNRKIICDGHRRWTIAKTLGVSVLPCVVLNADPAIMFIRLNAGIMKISGKTYLTSWALSDDRKETLACLPKTYSRQITRLVELLGVPYVVAMGQAEKEGPGVVIWVDKIVANLSNRGETATESDVARWLIDNSMQGAVSTLLRRKDTTRREWLQLARAIQEDRPFLASGRRRRTKV